MKWLQKNALYIAWIQAIVAMAGSLYFSNVLGWTPCVLCWYIRIAMYPLVLLLAVAILRKSKDIEYYILPQIIIGLGISAYDYLLQLGVISEKLAPCTNGVSCATRYHTWFGFVTIPLLSFIAFIIIIICLWLDRKGRNVV